MKGVHFSRRQGRGRHGAASWAGGLLLLTLSLALAIHMPQRTMAANTVLWTEVDAPATSGTFVSEVCGDINEDGHVDLIGGSLGLGVWVAAGNGDGSWTPLGAVTDSGRWYGLALGDVNNDGKLDLVGAEDGSGVHVWTGDGAGGWATMTSPAGSGKYWSVALGDVNGDGKLDIAAGSGQDDGLKVWAGDGAGGWTSVSTGLPGTGYYADVALGDVDRNGEPDLVAASHGEGVRAWRDGGFWTERSTGLPASGDYYGIALGDLDNDGDLDIVASGDDVGVGAWTGSGGAIWSWVGASAGLPGSGDYWEVRLSDVNNDGNLDVAATSYGGGVRVWTGDGGGTWSEESTGLPDTGFYYSLALGDFDDDGMPDLSAGQNAGVQAWIDDGTPDALDGWLQIASPTTSGYYQALDVGDWNHDGKLDIVAASEGSGIQLWEGDGGNTWDEISDWTGPDLPTGGSYYGIGFGDINHNGWLDVVAGSGEETGIRAWLFMDEVAWIEHCDGLPGTGTYLDVALDDFSNDGYLDIAAVGKELGVRAWTGASWGWVRADFGLPGGATFLSVAFGDLNDDGNLDLVAGSEGDGLGVWQGDGAGHWTAQASPTTTGTWQGVALGDLNDDGKLDIVAAGDGLGVQAWAGDGAFGWTALATPAASGNYSRVALGDLNNDGKLDIAAGKAGDKGLEVWTGDGGTAWTSFSLNLPTSGEYPDVAFGEIDNDGLLDLVGAQYGGGSVHAWTGAEGAPPGGWDNFTPTGWISTTQKADCSIQVQDTGSGLDPGSAAYSFLGSTGTWSDWEKADCTGSNGTTDIETISALAVGFNQDSGGHPLYEGNWIKFQVADTAGNVGISGEYLVRIDTTPPTNPTSFPDSSHWPGGACQDDDTIWVDWDGASDATSGLDGYSYVFSTAYELPDIVVDTWLSEATSDPVADGNWYIYVRTRDEAGNWATDAAYDGPFCVDTGPPTNPTDFDSSHDVGVWSRDNTIYIRWWGAEDPGSGVYGYATTWWPSPGVSPPESVDTTDTSATSHALDDGDSWYFHLKTRDAAGNWTPDAVHWGPFYVDRTDPSAWISMSFHRVNSNPFTVRWAGLDDTSGIDTFHVQSSANGTDWDDWQVGTSAFTADFEGVPGDTTYFRVRATDSAGNVGDWSDPFDVTVGVDVWVQVEDEWDTPLSGAVVYLNGVEQGSTAGDGRLLVHYVVLDDELAAKYLIEQEDADKSEHEWPYGGNWSYRTYITNVDFDAAGNPDVHTVSNTYTTQVLTVRRDNPLIGFHILVSVEWDADSTFLTEVISGFHSASEYLFDLTDGQMLFEAIEVVDDKLHWAEADYHIHASNTEWPRARVGGMREGPGGHVQLGRYFDGNSSNQGAWDQSDAFRTTIHEWGHYGFHLYDEYLNSDGAKDGQGCTTDRSTTPAAEQACFMDYQYTATEICSWDPTHAHNTNTYQHARHLEPCWNTIYHWHHSGADRWILERPPDRGGIMAGPTSIPVADWTYHSLTDANTGVCAPYSTLWTYPTAIPVAGAEVWVENARTTQQGETLTDGTLVILGAHDGDTVRLEIECGPGCSWSDDTTASCPDLTAQAGSERVVTLDPFALDVSVVPHGSGDVLEIRASASAALSGPPQVEMWQDGAMAAVEVALGYDAATGTYTGTVTLNAALGLRGQLWAQAADTQGHMVTVLVPFNVEQVPYDAHAWLTSDDGNLDLFLKPYSLSADAAVSIAPSGQVSPTQDNLILVGNAYSVDVSTGEEALALPAALNLRYHAEMVANVIPSTLQIYRWDAQVQRWIGVGGEVDPDHNLVSTYVDHLSTFAVLGERAGPGKVYLPVVLKVGAS